MPAGLATRFRCVTAAHGAQLNVAPRTLSGALLARWALAAEWNAGILPPYGWSALLSRRAAAPYKEFGGIIIAAHQTASHLDFMAVTS